MAIATFNLCVKKYVEPVYFIARNWGIPYLIVREGKVENFSDHYYYINSGGERFKRHVEETWPDEDRAWNALDCSFSHWLREYSE
jgi:hypothetical protein